GEPLRLSQSRPGLARAARALRDTRADPPDDRRIPFCRLVPAGPDTATLKPRDEPRLGISNSGPKPWRRASLRSGLTRAPTRAMPITPKPYWLRQPCWHPHALC